MDKNEMRIKNKALYREEKGEGNLAVLAYRELRAEPRKVTVALDPGGTKDIKAYSIVMASAALGKSVIQMRVWIDKGFIPSPLLRVVSHGYAVYDHREMEIIRKHLYNHTQKGISYLTDNSIDFVDALSKEINKYRKKHYAS